MVASCPVWRLAPGVVGVATGRVFSAKLYHHGESCVSRGAALVRPARRLASACTYSFGARSARARSRARAGDLVEVERDGARALDGAVAEDADEPLRLLVEGVLERDDDELVVAVLGALADEVGDARDVDLCGVGEGVGVGLEVRVRVGVGVRGRSRGGVRGRGRVRRAWR